MVYIGRGEGLGVRDEVFGVRGSGRSAESRKLKTIPSAVSCVDTFVTTPSLDWLWWTGGGVLGALGLALGVWALLADRSRGRRRCPKCWYDLSGTPGRVCSECGFRAKREKKLFKTRRRWRWAIVAAAVLVIAAASAETPKVQREGWTALVPTTALIVYLPWINEPERSPALALLDGRMPSRYWLPGTEPPDWWDWQWRLLAKRCLDGDAKRKPQSKDWNLFYSPLLTKSITSGGVLEDAGIRRRLASRFPVATTIRPLPREGSQPGLRCRLDIDPMWWGFNPTWWTSIEYRVTATPQLEDTMSLEARWFWNRCAVGQSLVGHDEQAIGTLPVGQRAVAFDVIVECRRLWEEEPWRPFSTSVVTVPLTG